VAGIRIGFDDVPGDTRTQPPAARLLLLPTTGPLAEAFRPWGLTVAAPGQGWLRSVAEVGLASPRVWNDAAQVTTVDETWRTSDGATHASVTRAWQHARHAAGGVPLHAADPAIDTASV
jgi:hypothetical protein